MSQNPGELKKPSEEFEELEELARIAANMKLPENLRTDAIKQLGVIATYEAFLTLLNLAANEGLITKERDLALQQAREILKKTSP
jgi:hypothetical protein